MTPARPFTQSLLAAFLIVVAAPSTAQRAYDIDILEDQFGFDRGETESLIPLKDLSQGCPSRDCIASIDNPKYVTAIEADHVDDDDLVLALTLQGYSRAWPTRILDQHEIVNDFIGGDAIAITWCPLCGSAIGVKREFDSRVTEFGVSGLLYNSDLVFYDRLTGSLWEQIEAKAFVGPLKGQELELVPITLTRWGQWKAAHPDTLVLSSDTGFERDYTVDNYARYRRSNNLMFPVSERDRTIPPKSVVFGFEINGKKVAFTEDHLLANRSTTYDFSGVPFDVRLVDDGSVSMTNTESGDIHHPVRLFWFAWYTFHPETELVR